MLCVKLELERLRQLVPEGAKLRVIRKNNHYQYFMKNQGFGPNGKYIKKENMELAVMLAQLEYDEKLITALKEVILLLEKCKGAQFHNPFEYALNQMVQGKRELIKMPYVSDEQFVRDWLNQNYVGIPFKEGTSEFYTRKGLRVRSKSEVIIADILDEMFIPFLYEKPLQLKGELFHPDFTLLNIKKRKEIFWEHFGMMDDKEYRDIAFEKIREYEANGFYQFDTVIWTFETGKKPINTRDIRNMIVKLKDSLGY